MKPWKLIGWRTLGALLTLVGIDRGLYHFGNHGKWVVQERHPHLGWHMLPNQNGWSRYYDVRERTNTLGYRGQGWPSTPADVRSAYADDAPPVAPVEGDARGDDILCVAVVGNSMTYGSSVAENEIWTARLEVLLREELALRGDPRRVHVLNFAVQGYVFDQMARTFDQRIAPFLPDILIVPTTTYDLAPMAAPAPTFDYPLRRWVVRTAISDFALRRVQGRWMPGPSAPSFDPEVPDIEGNRRRWAAADADQREVAWRLFALDRGASPAALAAVEPELRLAYFERASETAFERLWARAKGAERSALLTLLPPALFERVRQTLQHELTAQPFQPSNRWMWDRAASTLDGLRQRLEAHGGQLVLIALPTLSRLSRPDQPSTSAYWAPWARSDGPRAFEFDPAAQLRARMPELASFLRDPAIFDRGPRGELSIPRAAPEIETSLFFANDTGHYNARGHAALAEAVSARIVSAGLLVNER